MVTLTKPNEGDVGWADEINQNFTDIENELALVDLVNDFRPTLTSGDSRPEANVTGATTIYLTPDKGNRIDLCDGGVSGAWVRHTTGEVSIPVGTLTDLYPHYLYAYWDPSTGGAVKLEKEVWASHVAPTNAVVRVDGVWTKYGDPTRRLVGVFMPMDDNTHLEFTKNKVGIVSIDNPWHRRYFIDASDTAWSTTNTSFEPLNSGGTTEAKYVFEVVCPFGNEEVKLTIALGQAEKTVASNLQMTFEQDYSAPAANANIVYLGALVFAPISCLYAGAPGIGYHFIRGMQCSQDGNLCNFYGVTQSGLFVEVTV